jgi:hypothetical protein
MSEIKLWRQMTNRFTRHDYDYGDYWNALDSAIEIIERQQKEIKALKLLLEVKDELLVAYKLGTSPKSSTWTKRDKAEKLIAALDDEECKNM